MRIGDEDRLKVILIRHGKTKGNMESRYIGATDEPLCREGMEEIRLRVRAGAYPGADIVYASPLKRCIHTAELIYPEKTPILCADLRECYFGEFENKNYLELAGNENYKNWLAGNGTLEFPGGESQEDFKKRCRAAYETIIGNSRKEDTALVVHGGTIMAVLERYGEPRKGFYDWQLKNGEGYLCELKEDNIRLKVLLKLGERGGQHG